MDTDSVLLRPLTDEELALIEQSRRDFAEGRTMTSEQVRASIGAALGLPKAAK